MEYSKRVGKEVQKAKAKAEYRQESDIMQIARMVGNGCMNRDGIIQGEFEKPWDRDLNPEKIRWNTIRTNIRAHPTFFDNTAELNAELDVCEDSVKDEFMFTIIGIFVRGYMINPSVVYNEEVMRANWGDIPDILGRISGTLGIEVSVTDGMKGHPGSNYTLSFYGTPYMFFIPSSTHGRSDKNLKTVRGEICRALGEMYTGMDNIIFR